MSSNGPENVMLSDPVIKSVKEIVQPGTAKLLIDADGTVRLEANSNFPKPGSNDKQTLFASCTDDGQTNVYYSPSGNPSEVYLLKPTAKSAGKQLKLTTREPIFIKESTVGNQPSQSQYDKRNPIVMSMIGQNTEIKKPSSLPSSTKSNPQAIPSTSILSPPTVCSIATSTSSSPLDSPVDDSDFPIDLPVSFETDIKDSIVNSDIDELDSLVPDIGSTIAAHLHSKDSQQNTVAQKENMITNMLTQKSPVIMPRTTMANNPSVKMPFTSKTIATIPGSMVNSNGQLLLLTTSTGQNQCIYLTENEKLPSLVPDFSKLVPTIPTNNSVPPTGNAFSLLQPSFKPLIATAPSKPLNTVSLLKGPVSQKTVPRILNVSNHPQTKQLPTSQQTPIPIIVMPKSTPMATNSTNVPVKVVSKTTPVFANVTQMDSGNKSGLKFVNSNASVNKEVLSTKKTNPEPTIMSIGETSASQCLKKVVTNASGSKPTESVKVYPKVSSTESIACENKNNNNDKDNEVKESEDTSCNIRIDSVFSLSEPSQSSEQSEAKTKKDRKRKRKNFNKHKKFKMVTEVKEYKCKPMYVVLERLAISKNTVNVNDTLSKIKCTDYCRKRTLNCLCDIDLLDCRNPALSTKAQYLQRRRVEITPPSPSKIARHISDSDVKSGCDDDWTLVEEGPKLTTTTTSQVHKPSILTDHSSYTTNSKISNSSYYKYLNKPTISPITVSMLPTNVTKVDSKIHSTQQAFEGALQKAVASKNVPSSATETKTLQNKPTLIKIPFTVSSTKTSNPSIVTDNFSSTTSTISSTTSSVSTVSSTPTPIKPKQNVLNGKFFLVTIDGKNVLIPTEKSVNNKAFILQQAADGTTGLIPACLSYNKTTPTAPIINTATQKVTSVNTTKSVMNIRSIAPKINSPVSLVGTPNPGLRNIPTRFTKTSEPISPVITAANVSTPQAVSMVPNIRLATPDVQMKSPVIQNIIPRPSNNDTPSPTIDSTKKRKKTLAERYPLPPGVIIKQEPRTTGYGDEPKREEVIKAVNPPTLLVTSNPKRLVQSVLTPSVVPRFAATPTSNIITLSNTPGNSKSLLGKPTSVQRVGNVNRNITVPATNIRSVNVSHHNTQTRNLQPPINIVKHFPVSNNAPRLAQAPAITASVLKNNTISFTKLPNSYVTTKINDRPIPSKTQESATERSIPAISRKPSLDKKVETNSRPDSPGPPDLGEPQIILPSMVAQHASYHSDTDSDTDSAAYSYPVYSSPALEKTHEEPKAKTPQQLRIEKLKEQLREQERALEEMRKKKAFECPIDIDDDD